MKFVFPDSFRFADSHEYVSIEGEFVRIGISIYAVDQSGDIVFVELPEVGTELSVGVSFGAVESVKAVEDMYAPIDGKVVKRNEAVLTNPEKLQNDPHLEGWLLIVKPEDFSQIDLLLNAESYQSKINSN